MIDGVVVRVIQIEGEDKNYLMDPEGKIYDMEANFIGTANTSGLEETEASWSYCYTCNRSIYFYYKWYKINF